MLEYAFAFLLCGLLVSCVVVLPYSIIGFVLFKLGFKKIGHFLFSMGIVVDDWLIRNCPYTYGEKCRVIGCPAYSRKRSFDCRLNDNNIHPSER